MDITCAICLENIINITNKLTFKCEHFFHKICINNYMNNCCPICKEVFIKSNIYYINNIDNYNFKNIILIKNNLHKSLSYYFNTAEKLLFLKLLNKNVILSGSFVLSIILNENYNNTNLNIFIDNYSDYKLIKKFLIDCYYNKKELDNYNFSNTDINKINKKIRFTKDEQNIDIIFNDNNYLLLKYQFELDIFKNYYDGQYFYVFDKTKLELKIDYISMNKITTNLEKNIIKYRNRGFQIYLV